MYEEVHEIYPEYYVIKVNAFDDIAKDSLDEWIYFFKHSKVPNNFKAKGLKEVQEKMKIERLSVKEKAAYEKHQLNLVSERNVIETARIEGKVEGKIEGMELTVQIIGLFNQGKTIDFIAKQVNESPDFVNALLKKIGLVN